MMAMLGVIDEISTVLQQIDQCSMTLRDLSEALRNQNICLLANIKEENIENIDAHFGYLRIAYDKEGEAPVLLLKAQFDAIKWIKDILASENVCRSLRVIRILW